MDSDDSFEPRERERWEPSWARRIHDSIINRIDQMEARIMSDQSELDTDVAALTAAVASVGATLAAEIQALNDKIASGQAVNAADLAGIAAATAALTDPSFGQPAPPAPPAPPTA